MTPGNWKEKYPAEVYSSFFRFQKDDMELLACVLEIPLVMHMETRHQTNRLYILFIKDCLWLEDIIIVYILIYPYAGLRLFIYC